MTNDAYFNTIV